MATDNISQKVAQLNILFNSLTNEEMEDFLKLNGLFHASFLDPLYSEYLENKTSHSEEIEEDYISLMSKTKEEINQMVSNIEANINKLNKAILIPLKDNKISTRCLSDYQLYDIIFSSNFDKGLILTQANYNNPNEINHTEYNNLLEKVKNQFNDADCWNLDVTISKQLLPKLIERFKNNTHSYPPDITEDEWNTILSKLIWFCNEIITDNGWNISNKTKEQYNNDLIECSQLLGKYFMDLWD